MRSHLSIEWYLMGYRHSITSWSPGSPSFGSSQTIRIANRWHPGSESGQNSPISLKKVATFRSAETAQNSLERRAPNRIWSIIFHTIAFRCSLFQWFSFQWSSFRWISLQPISGHSVNNVANNVTTNFTLWFSCSLARQSSSHFRNAKPKSTIETGQC